MTGKLAVAGNEQVKAIGRRCEEIKRRASEGTLVLEEVAQGLQWLIELSSSEITSKAYKIRVDGSRADMIGAGKYSLIEDMFDNNDPRNPFDPVDTTTIEARLFHFTEQIHTYNATDRLRELKLRSATLLELLAFGKKYPNIQRKFPIVALHLVWEVGTGAKGVPMLGCFCGRRTLEVAPYDSDWPADFYHFLVCPLD